MTAASVRNVPAAALLIKVDTLGDLILFAPTLTAIRVAWPSTKLVVLIRRAYLEFAPVLVKGVEWMPTTLDPFARGPDADPAELERLRQAVIALKPDLVAAATSRRNWLELALAAASGAPDRIALGETADAFFSTQLRVKSGIDSAAAFRQYVDVPADEPDWRRNYRLADALLSRQVERTPPSLSLDPALRGTSAPILARESLVAGRYVVCAAAGFANVALKTWPADRFATVLKFLREKHGLPTLLVGHESERAHLESVRALSGGASLWLGGDSSLPTLAALIADAALFLGNDTGAMHLAAALDIPVVGVFGGGTWPRFVPAARRGISVVQPLPCFGCGWDCAFGDAPCIGGIAIDDVTGAVSFAVTNTTRNFSEIRAVEPLPAAAREMMGKAAARYRALRAEHHARQQEFERTVALAAERETEINAKDAEIVMLKSVCDERERTIFILDRNVRDFSARYDVVHGEKLQLEQTLANLPSDTSKSAKALHDQSVHIRNIEALLQHRQRELDELKATSANRAAGLHDLEQAKHYGRLLAEKEAVIQALRRGCEERENVIKDLSASATTPTAKLRKLWIAASAHAREKWWRPLDAWLFRKMVDEYWMQIGVLRHYDPRPLLWDKRLPGPALADSKLPQIGLVTPSYGQERFIERTLHSVLDQHYPKLLYVVQDGGSKDRSAEIIARHSARLRHWESEKDNGQADAIRRGFIHIEPALGPEDVMAWLNSDDMLAPGSLRYVAEYFATHPDVDVIYGHRIIIDDDDCDIGRWIMPRHDPAALEWIDYVPQETLFWRKRAWDLAGGIDPTFQFALDWDLLARFQLARCRIVRVPYFLGAFRVHAEQKTSQAIHTTGADEMRRIRMRFHGERQDDTDSIQRHARATRFQGALTARLHAIGIRW
jgi:ADP-heptose:LPS heptosyltransferase/GT2 family glycosyltransferase